MYAIAQSVENRPPTLQITKAHNYKSQEYYIIRKNNCLHLLFFSVNGTYIKLPKKF